MMPAATMPVLYAIAQRLRRHVAAIAHARCRRRRFTRCRHAPRDVLLTDLRHAAAATLDDAADGLCRRHATTL